MTRVEEAEADKFMRVAVAKAQDAQFVKRPAARREMGHWNEWRDLAEQIRQHVIKYLPDYLEEFSNNVERRRTPGGPRFLRPNRRRGPQLHQGAGDRKAGQKDRQVQIDGDHRNRP